MSSRRVGSAFVVALGLYLAGVRVAPAAVDLNGRFHVMFGGLFADEPPQDWDFIQVGTQLTVIFTSTGGQQHVGTIDANTGVFDIDLGPAQNPVCLHDRLQGTGAQDSYTFSGAFVVTDPFCSVVTVPANGSRCGNGSLDGGEGCDDDNRVPGDCCSPQCQPEPSGNACPDDGNVCTDEHCDGAGTCQHLANTASCTTNGGCTSGTCAGGSCTQSGAAAAGTPCDTDQTVCTQEACDASGACVSGGTLDCAPCGICNPQVGCVGGASSSCVSPSRASLKLSDPAGGTRDSVVWKWSGSSPGPFGDPTGATYYALCVFLPDQPVPGGGVPLLLNGLAPADGTCGSSACWKATYGGYKYSDRERTPAGISTIKLKVHGNGSATLSVKGKGPNLGLPAALPAGAHIGAQLLALQGQGFVNCWDSDFPTPTISTPTKFVGKE